MNYDELYWQVLFLDHLFQTYSLFKNFNQTLFLKNQFLKTLLILIAHFMILKFCLRKYQQLNIDVEFLLYFEISFQSHSMLQIVCHLFKNL